MRLVVYALMALAAASLLPWLMVAPMSLMAFDSGPNPIAYGLVGAMLLYPVWLIYWLWRSWHALKAGTERAALLQTLLAASPAIVLLGVLTIGSNIAPHR